jgi:hypothetical protein
VEQLIQQFSIDFDWVLRFWPLVTSLAANSQPRVIAARAPEFSVQQNILPVYFTGPSPRTNHSSRLSTMELELFPNASSEQSKRSLSANQSFELSMEFELFSQCCKRAIQASNQVKAVV